MSAARFAGPISLEVVMENTIKVKPWGEGQGNYVLIDADSFDPLFHALLEDETQQQKRCRKPKAVEDGVTETAE